MTDYLKAAVTPSRPIDECRHGVLYRLRSRNLSCGVWKADVQGFVGVREKFGDTFCFTEYHYGQGAPFGTANAYEELAECPITDLRDGWVENDRYVNNEELFFWLAPYDDIEREQNRQEWEKWRNHDAD